MGNGASVQTPQTADIQDLFEDTVFNELEIRRISVLNAENGTEAILATLLPMPLLPHILSWLADQARRENLSEGITIEQIIYLLDTLHPSQLIENKRDLAWKLYDIDEDGYIAQYDLARMLRYLLPSLPLSKYQVLARRALSRFPEKRVARRDFDKLVPDAQLLKILTRPILT